MAEKLAKSLDRRLPSAVTTRHVIHLKALLSSNSRRIRRYCILSSFILLVVIFIIGSYGPAYQSQTKAPYELPLIIAVISGRSHFDRREAVRQTWGNQALLKRAFGSKLLGPLFFIGQPEHATNVSATTTANTEGQSVEARLLRENAEFGDIVTLQTIDRYQLLTPKMMEAFGWIREKLKNTTSPDDYYILKTDDDAYVNVIEIVRKFYSNFTEKTFYCHLLENYGIIREPLHKNYVPKEVYAPDTYPTFCSGVCYLFNATSLDSILYEARQQKFLLPNEDTMFTGTLAEKLGMKHVELGQVELFTEAGKWSPEKLCLFASRTTDELFRFVVHHVTPQEMRMLHKCITLTYSSCSITQC